MESYSEQIKDYVLNYDEALENIKSVYNQLDELYSSFSASSGLDIERIRNDIKVIKDSLEATSKTIKTARDNTVARADSCDRCYTKYKNKSYPAYETSERKYFSGANVYIDKNGLIHVSREYSKKLSFIESIFMSNAGECYDDKTIGTEEMFNS